MEQQYQQLQYVMNKSELCKLIVQRSSQLPNLRKYAASNHQNYRQNFMAALAYLIKDPNTQPPAYQQISQLIITADPTLAKSLAQEIIIHFPKLHTKSTLDQHIIFWTRAYDGSIQKQQYPNYKMILKNIKIKQRDRDLSGKYKDYFQQFCQNYNEIHDQRIQFFEDFDDEMVSESLDNDSKLYDIVYLNIMELKIVRNKVCSQRLSEQQMQEQLNKLRYFVKLKRPQFLTESQNKEYDSELKWAQQFLINQQENIRKNQSISINQTFQLSLDQENIQIINKKQFQQKRILKNHNPQHQQKQYFDDSLDLKSSGKPDISKHPIDQKSLTISQPEKRIPTYKASHKGIFSSYASPIKQMKEDYYNMKMSQSKKISPIYVKQQVFESNNDDYEIQNLVVHKYGGKSKNSELPQKPRDFSVTQNYFKKDLIKTVNEIASPTYPRQNIAHSKSQTLKQWQKHQNMSPHNSRCKLSEFTSQKKQRKQLVPRSQISFPEDFAINPYLIHFDDLNNLVHFRRNCFERSITLYTSPYLVVNCNITKEANNQIKVQIVYTNHQKVPLEVESVYKIPLCYTIQKKSKINKRFTLHNSQSHLFSIGIEQFPLEACIINLKYSSLQGKSKKNLLIPFPVTIINFIEYLIFSEMEWTKQWELLKNDENRKVFQISKNIQLDRQASCQELDWLLRDYFFRISAVEGYSVQDYGCCCFYSSMNKLKFLIRLSVRVNNIVSIEMVSCRAIEQNQQDFMRYILNIWMFLLTKL